MADRYWINTTSGNWNDTANWSTSPTGAGGSSVPTSSDDAYFTSSRNGNCILNATASVLSLIFTDSDPAISTTGYTGTLLGGYFIQVYGGYCWFSSTMTMKATGDLVFRYGGGVSLNCGVNSFTMKIRITFAAGTVVYPRDDLYYANPRSSHNATGLDITVAGGGLDFTVFKKTFYVLTNRLKINLNQTSDNALKLWNLSYTVPNGILEFQYGPDTATGKKILIDNNLTIKPSSFEEEKIFFGMAKQDYITPGWDLNNRFEFTVNGVIDIDNCIMSNIVADGDKWDLTSTNTSNAGGNDNIDFPVGITSYYVGGAANGNFNDSTKWKTTSGGSSPARVPLCQDTARIDANSFSGARTLTFDKVYLVTQNIPSRFMGFYPKVDFTGSSGVTFDTTAVWYNRYGGVNLQDLDTITMTTSGPWVFINDTDSFLGLGTQDIAPNIIYFYGTGKLSLVSNLSFTANVILGLVRGDFDTNNYNISCSRFNLSVSGTGGFVRSANFRNSVLTLTSDSSPINISSGFFYYLTLNAGTSTIRLTAVNPSGTIDLFGKFTFYNLEIATTETVAGSAFTLNGNYNTYNNIKILAGSNLKFTAGTTSYIKSFTAMGTSANRCIISGGTAATYYLVKSGTGLINEVDYCDISYSAASPANTWYAGDNSSDEGNNSGWLFEDAPSGGDDYYKSLSDSIKLVDVVKTEYTPGYKDYFKTIEDSFSLFDSEVKEFNKIIGDLLSLVDVFDKLFIQRVSLSDEFSLSESVSSFRTARVSLIDSIVLVEDLNKKYVGVRSFIDNPVLFDSGSKSFGKTYGDEFSVSDVVNKKGELVIRAHCPTLNDSMSLIPGKNLVSDFSLSDDLSKHFEGNRVLLDELVLNDIILKDNELNFSDNIGLNSVLNNKTVKILSDGFSVNDSYERNMFKNIVDEVLLFDSDKKFYSKGLFDNISFKEFVEGGTFISLTDSVKLDDVKSNLVSKNRLSDKLSLVDLVDKKMVTELNDSFNLFDDVVKKPGKVLLDNFLLTDYHVFSIVKYIKDVIGLNEFVNKSIFKFPFSDEFVLADSVFKKPVKDLLDELVLDDSVSRFVSRIYDDNITLYDSDSKHTLKVLKDFIDYRDKVLKKPGKVLLNELSLFDLNVIKNVLLVKKDELFLDEVLSKFVSKKPFIDEIILDDVVNKTSMKPLNDSFNITDLNVLPDLKQTITEMQQDFISILHDIPAAEYIDWVRRGKIEDEFGRYKTGKDEFVKKIYIILQPLTEKDRNILPQGVNVNSYMKAYAEPRYYYGNKRIDIKAGDIFIRSDGQKYMVEQVAGKWGNFKAQVFRKLLLKGIDNDA